MNNEFVYYERNSIGYEVVKIKVRKRFGYEVTYTHYEQ